MQYEQSNSLPQPDAASAQQSALVREHLREKIAAAGGRISFAQFMQEVLYAPRLGYYTAGSRKFGADGDFVTAPEVSAVFGRVVARQIAEVLAQIEKAQILECGAGSGKLAVDVLRALGELEMLPEIYSILEVSPDLVERQKRRIQKESPEIADRVVWLSSFPENFDGVILANEVLDALPVERFVRAASGVSQLCVSDDDTGFVWVEEPAGTALRIAVQSVEADLGASLPIGYTSEISLAATHWIGDIARSLRRGTALLFDYGVTRREFYATDRSDGWLRCHFRHYAHSDPLVLPGIQDLTSWVDFSAIADAACASGLDVLGYQTQAQFLLGGGLQAEMEGFEHLSDVQQIKLSGQIKTLTLPGEMGESFKCIALGRGDVTPPSAFDFADRTYTL